MLYIKHALTYPKVQKQYLKKQTETHTEFGDLPFLHDVLFNGTVPVEARSPAHVDGPLRRRIQPDGLHVDGGEGQLYDAQPGAPGFVPSGRSHRARILTHVRGPDRLDFERSVCSDVPSARRSDRSRVERRKRDSGLTVKSGVARPVRTASTRTFRWLVFSGTTLLQVDHVRIEVSSGQGKEQKPKFYEWISIVESTTMFYSQWLLSELSFFVFFFHLIKTTSSM